MVKIRSLGIIVMCPEAPILLGFREDKNMSFTCLYIYEQDSGTPNGKGFPMYLFLNLLKTVTHKELDEE